MKESIHPKYGPCEVICACGSVFETRSTKVQLKVETCSVCHPHWTGKSKAIAKTSQAQKFIEKMERAKQKFGAQAGEATSTEEKASAPST